MAALREVTGAGQLAGVSPQRVPPEVWSALSPLGQARMRDASGVELRWVNEVPEEPVHVTLSAPDPERPVDVVAYWGDFRGRVTRRLGVVAQRCEIRPFHRWLEHPVARGGHQRWTFAPQVCRLVFSGGPLVLHSVEGSSLRVPRAEELPDRRYLAYGTSITQGFVATGHHLSFVSLLARALRADTYNLGSGSSCHCEPAMADHLAGLPYDFATFCLSVNMVRSFTVEEFGRRVHHLLQTVVRTHPHQPLLAISPMPWYDEWSGEASAGRTSAFRATLRHVVAAFGHPVHYVDGREALTDLAGLSDDLLHLSDHGMIAVARVLEDRLAGLLPSPSTETFR